MKLTKAQWRVLAVAAAKKPGQLYQPYGPTLRPAKALAMLGLLTPAGSVSYRITDAGRAALKDPER